MIIYVDIDNTICKSNDQYENAVPIKKNIGKINKLFDEGNVIIYWTARGRTTGIDWSEITKNQLIKWGCKFNDIIMNDKPYFDLLIDDKSKRINEI